MTDEVAEVHRSIGPLMVDNIVQSVRLAGGDAYDVLVLLEAVTAGVLLSMNVIGNDDVADALHRGIKRRLSDLRLIQQTPSGSA